MKKKLIAYCLILSGLFLFQQIGQAKVSTSGVTPSPIIGEKFELLDVYPNPAIDYIFVKFTDKVASKATIEVRSFIGNKMKAKTAIESSNLVKVDIADMPAGHYYLLITIDGANNLKKFVKRS